MTEDRQLSSRQAFDEAVFVIVKQIPAGRVMTYGGIASLIPPPETIDPSAYVRIRARWVSYALKKCPESLPWHRVVNARGAISSRHGTGPALQRALLEDEGIEFDENNQLDLKALYWDLELDPISSG